MLHASTTTTRTDWMLQPAMRSGNTESTTPQNRDPAHSEALVEMDSACMQAIAEGDRDALSNIILRWQNRLINFFYRSTSNRSDAEDLAQETFVELYKSAARYNPENHFRAFLFTIARRRLIDSYRKKSRRPLTYMDPTDFAMQQPAAETNQRSEIEEAFHKALTELPENQRNAILMRQQQELSYEEIADVLETTVSSVKTWIHRARQHLRTRLKDFR